MLFREGGTVRRPVVITMYSVKYPGLVLYFYFILFSVPQLFLMGGGAKAASTEHAAEPTEPETAPIADCLDLLSGRSGTLHTV